MLKDKGQNDEAIHEYQIAIRYDRVVSHRS
jgi:hypothetical protein